MKKHFFVLMVFISLKTFAQQTAIISGHILNNTKSSISIGDTNVFITKTGDFSISLPINNKKLVDVKYGEREFTIFVKPGTDQQINFDAKMFDSSIRFKGANSSLNHVLLDHSYTDREVDNYFNRQWTKLFSKDEKDFIATIDSLKFLYFRIIETFESRKESLDPDFIFTIKNEINFGYDWLILLYPQQHSIFTGNHIEYSPSTISRLDSINLDDIKLLEVANYKKFGQEWLNRKVRSTFINDKELRKLDNQWLNSAFSLVFNTFKDKAIQAFWLHKYLLNHIENNGIKNISENIKIFNSVCQDSVLQKEINEKYKIETEKNLNHLVKAYKNIDGKQLDAHIFLPKDLKENEKRPVMVYFHGGSWSEGKPDWQFRYSPHGLINIAVEYRTFDRHAALPAEEISDTKSFFRWLRLNGPSFGVDTSKIGASGNSAGGHLILSAAMLDTLDEATEDFTISSKPDLLILNSAVFDLSGWNWFDQYKNYKEMKISISPLQSIKKGLPPMLVFHGSEDSAVPIAIAREFVEKMKEKGNPIEFYPIQNASHELWLNDNYWRLFNDVEPAFLRKYQFLK